MAQSWGKRIRALREKAGWTQVQLAAAAKVCPSTVSGWERGTISLSVGSALSLSRTFGVTLDELLNEPSAPRLASAKRLRRAEALSA